MQQARFITAHDQEVSQDDRTRVRAMRPHRTSLRASFMRASQTANGWGDVTFYCNAWKAGCIWRFVIDLYSRKVVGWSMGERLTTALAQRAIRHAIEQREPSEGLIAHSDRGMEILCEWLSASY